LLLKAFAQTRHRFPNARLVLLTKDSVPPSLPLDGVQVMPLTWRREEILDLYERADLFVMPSRLETWGDVFLEAMAFGLPCIGVTGQAMNEIIRHGETGYLVPPEDVPALSGALTDLFSDAGKRFEMGNAAREVVQREFTWDHVVNRLMPMLRSA
jgi:glycosyltransferase involved in cell wall biosynthesis